MIRENEINKIATRLGWAIDETKEALKEFYEFPSVINKDEFLRICYKAKDPKVRWDKIVVYLINNLNDDIVDTICSIIRVDICFLALSLFNYNDLWHDPIFPSKKSFSSWLIPYDTEDTFSKKKSKNGVIKELIKLRIEEDEFSDRLIWPRELVGLFLDIYWYCKVDLRLHEDKDRPKIEDVILRVLDRVGFLALNMTSFREYISQECYYPFRKSLTKSFEIDIKSIFNKTLLNRSNITQDKYWIITKEHGFGLRQSSRKLASVFYTTAGTIRTRYAEKKKEAKRKNLMLKEIIAEHKLHIHINDILNEVL